MAEIVIVPMSTIAHSQAEATRKTFSITELGASRRIADQHFGDKSLTFSLHLVIYPGLWP
jgi:hypothetical protein